MQTAISPIPSSDRGWIHGPGNDGFIKLIADVGAGMLIGATSAGSAGGEVLGALAVAVHAQVPVAMLSRMLSSPRAAPRPSAWSGAREPAERDGESFTALRRTRRLAALDSLSNSRRAS